MRRGRVEDAPAIAALVLRAYAHYPERIGVRPGPMDADYQREVADKEVWVTEAGGGLTGVLVLRPEPDHVFVDNVAVAPDAQGTGVGRALLAHAERRAAELGVREVRLLTHELMSENRALYAALGWESVERPADDPFPRAHFRKRVGV